MRNHLEPNFIWNVSNLNNHKVYVLVYEKYNDKNCELFSNISRVKFILNKNNNINESYFWYNEYNDSSDGNNDDLKRRIWNN